MVEVKDLRKVFKRSSSDMKRLKEKNKKANSKEKVAKSVVAVDRLSFVAKDGQIFGLLGANGAGKTTSLRCISTLYKPNDGNVFVDGVDVTSDPDYARKNIAFLTSELKLDKYFTPDYTLTYYGRLRGMSKQEIEERKDELCDIFDINEFRYKKIGELSTGMLQKTSIAVSMIHDPKVIVFDEPTNGLDIITARRVTDFLVGQKEKGKTVIISTHIMSLVEKLCDRVAIIMDGSLVIEGTISEVLEQTDKNDLEDAFFALMDMREQEAEEVKNESSI